MTAEALCSDAGDTDHHRVAFYTTDSELIAVGVDAFHEALRGGVPVVIIASQTHRDGFRSGLDDLLDTSAAVADGRLVMLDARETLAGFMVDGCPDPERFDATVGALVRRTLARGEGLLAFGEMVALLWADGLSKAAIRLEELWNGLIERHAFSLLCAYPTGTVVTDDDPAGYGEIGAVHTSIVSGPPVAADAEAVRHFAAHIGSPRLVRKFVRRTLERWALYELVDEATIVATELATNAIRHGNSHFALGLARSPRGLRLTVGDSSEDLPAPRDAVDDSGRGLQMVAATARAWGHRTFDSGKLVWAEIEALPDVSGC